MRQANGFTLVELLFALVAGSLLLILLGWAIRGLSDEWRRHGRATAAEEVEGATPFLQAMVGHAAPPTKERPILASPSELALDVPPPDALASTGTVRLDLSVRDLADGAALVATLAPRQAGTAFPDAARRSDILVHGFRAIRFVYNRSGADPAGSLPRLVTLIFTAKDGTLLPLGLEPRLSEGASCAFDSVAQSCRP